MADDKKTVYEWEVPKDHPNFTGYDDLAKAYRIVYSDKASGGCIVEAKYNDKWIASSWSARPLIRHLFDLLNIRNDEIDHLKELLGKAQLLFFAAVNSNDKKLVIKDQDIISMDKKTILTTVYDEKNSQTVFRITSKNDE